MQIKEYLKNVCEQIKYTPIRNEISEELQSHIEESKQNYIEQGVTEVLAEEKAIKQMGEAEQIGKELNKIHKPKFNIQLLLLALVLLTFGFLVSYVDKTDKYKLNFISIILCTIPAVLIYFFDYRKLEKYSSLMYAIPTIVLIYMEIQKIYPDNIRTKIASMALILYTIAFIGFIKNIDKTSKIEIKFLKKNNINVNLVKIIALSIISLKLLYDVTWIATAIILALVYLIISTVKLIQANKKKQTIFLWGIVMVIAILVTVFCTISTENFRKNRIITSFVPEVDPNGSGWQGMEQKQIINSAKLFGKAEGVTNVFDEGTNFAFITVLANYGWIISITMVIMILAFNIKLIIDARKVKDRYGKFLIIGIGCLFIIRSTLCMLMNVNLGIKSHFDIPFISYGISNLVIDIISLAIIFSVYRRKDIILNVNRKAEIYS